MPARFHLIDIPSGEGLPPPLLALNNEFAQELSFLSPEKAAHLVREAAMACRATTAHRYERRSSPLSRYTSAASRTSRAFSGAA